MRPIDADKILELHELETKLIGKDWTIDDLAAAIEHAPTILAIPVEWLNQKYAENEPGEDKDYDYFLWDAIPYILTEWQKEQEAR